MHSSRLRTAHFGGHFGGVYTPCPDCGLIALSPSTPPSTQPLCTPFPCPSACRDSHPLPGCMLGYTPPLWTEWLTGRWKNITFLQLRSWAVKNEKKTTGKVRQKSRKFCLSEKLGTMVICCLYSTIFLFEKHINSMGVNVRSDVGFWYPGNFLYSGQICVHFVICIYFCTRSHGNSKKFFQYSVCWCLKCELFNGMGLSLRISYVQDINVGVCIHAFGRCSFRKLVWFDCNLLFNFEN